MLPSYKITLLVGHRGVGKTRLLRRIQDYRKDLGEDALFLDLDHEIIKETGQSIEGFFAEKGEAQFRLQEESTLQRLVDFEPAKKKWIALGAGFRGELPQDALVIWVRRPSDEMGRIFLDRPRLQKEETALREYFLRKPERDQRYAEQCHLQLFLREGVEEHDHGESLIFGDRPIPPTGELTLKKSDMPLVFHCPARRWEIRDDDWNEKERLEIEGALKDSSSSTTLLAHRQEEREFSRYDDWPLELGRPPAEEQFAIISVHERELDESLPQLLGRLEQSGGQNILKAAPQIDSFEELLVGHQWQQEDPEKRAFLPRSENGRWKWYRLFMKAKMPLNFWRLSAGSAADQPTLIEWLNHSENAQEFAAVLGSPVQHSHTPVEQESFFVEQGWPTYAIDCAEEEWSKAFEALRTLGLRAAAVTSPLKHSAYLSSTVRTIEAEDLQAVNTLFIEGEIIHGHNTDFSGFREMVVGEDLPGPVAVWGGGGTLSVILKQFENATCFAARTGQPRALRDLTEYRPKTLIWACGRDERYKWPLKDWELDVVVDMNYTENSMGRELAQALGSRYVSGLKMFKAQAAAQRKHWGSLMAKKDRS